MIGAAGYAYRFDPSACRTCGGRCCNGESGRVRVTAEEIGPLAVAKGLDPAAFRTAYLLPDADAWRLRENRDGANYACALYDRRQQGCSAYAARPRQCRTFPFWEYWRSRVDELMRECPGVSALAEP